MANRFVSVLILLTKKTYDHEMKALQTLAQVVDSDVGGVGARRHCGCNTPTTPWADLLPLAAL
jgi:hypothetical protein